MQWFRWWAGTFNDPKIGLWSSLSGLSKSEGISVFIALLECASEAEDRGDVTRFDAEATAFWFQIDAEKVRKFVCVMTERGSIVNGRIASWDRRQPSDYSTDRVRKFRAKQKRSRNADRTVGNAAKRDETSRNAHSRAEQSRAEDDRAKASKPKVAEPLPRADDPALEGEDFPLLWLGDETSADRQLGWLGAIVDELPERDRKPVTDFRRMAVAGKILSEAQAGLLETLFQRHRAAIVAESNRRIGKRFPGLDAAAAHPVHGKAINRAMAARDDAEIDRLRKLVAEDLTPPAFLRRGAA